MTVSMNDDKICKNEFMDSHNLTTHVIQLFAPKVGRTCTFL